MPQANAALHINAMRQCHLRLMAYPVIPKDLDRGSMAEGATLGSLIPNLANFPKAEFVLRHRQVAFAGRDCWLVRHARQSSPSAL
jgi:hypothetical protein